MEFDEFRIEFIVHEIAAGADDLSEFDKGGTEFFEGEADADREGLGEDVVFVDLRGRRFDAEDSFEEGKA